MMRKQLTVNGVLLFLNMSVLMMLLNLPPAYCGGPALTPNFYARRCLNVESIVRGVVRSAVQAEPRMAASLLRLHFHDCFVNGCDASVLLDGPSGEKSARPNANSLRGFEVIDAIKAALEKACPATVSCADILAVAARDAVVQAGGPSWKVLFGRRDSTTASQSAANADIPSPFDSLSSIIAKFEAVGLTAKDVAVLSGAHTFGRARCGTFSNRLFNFNATGQPDPTIDPTFLQVLQQTCPQGGSSASLTNLDPVTPDRFDNCYFINLQKHMGVLLSDQELLSTPRAATASSVNTFARSQGAFFRSFAASMVSMGNINPLTGTQGQVRLDCRVANSS